MCTISSVFWYLLKLVNVCHADEIRWCKKARSRARARARVAAYGARNWPPWVPFCAVSGPLNSDPITSLLLAQTSSIVIKNRKSKSLFTHTYYHHFDYKWCFRVITKHEKLVHPPIIRIVYTRILLFIKFKNNISISNSLLFFRIHALHYMYEWYVAQGHWVFMSQEKLENGTAKVKYGSRASALLLTGKGKCGVWFQYSQDEYHLCTLSMCMHY